MPQKVIKIGKSTGITIPKEILEELNLKAGDQVVVEVDKKQGGAFIRTTKKKMTVDRELLDWTDRFIEEYRPALEALAKK